MAVNTAISAATVAQEHTTTGSVISKDGTTIGYRQIGHGPGVVLLHGAMESAQSHMQLAEALADDFTVYAVDRRGRGLSGSFPKNYSIQTEVDDLSAILNKTGAHYVFGVSAGGLIALQSALMLPAIQKIVVYEPALVVNGSRPTAFIKRYDEEMTQGKIAAALVTGMIGAQMGPAIFERIPRFLLEAMTTQSMKAEDKKAREGDITMRKLAPTLHYDFALVDEMQDSQNSFKALRPDVLLLGGSKSPAWLKGGLDALAKVLPHARRIEFPGLDHGGSSDPGSTNRGGDPKQVAQAVHEFFGADH